MARDRDYRDADSHDSISKMVNGDFCALHGLITVVKKETGMFGAFKDYLLRSIFFALVRGLSAPSVPQVYSSTTDTDRNFNPVGDFWRPVSLVRAAEEITTENSATFLWGLV